MRARPSRLASRVALVVGAIRVVACGASPGAPLALPSSTNAIARQAGSGSHLVVIVMENEELGSIIGSGDAPYINALARRYASASDYHAVSHPSLPNYLALTGGATFGINSDCTDSAVRPSSLADQLDGAGFDGT